MNIVIQRIKENYNKLSPAQKSIADYLMQHEKEIPNLTVRELAQNTYNVSSLVISFAKRVGYKGFNELKFSYENDATAEISSDIEKITLALKLAEKATKTKVFRESVDIIKSTKKIYIYASQMSQIPAKDFYFRMRKIAPAKVIFFESYEDQIRMSRMMEAGDVALIVSNSGECERIILMQEELKRKNIIQILVSNGTDSTLSKYVSKEIAIGCHEENPFLFKETPTIARYTLIYVLEKIFKTYFYELYDESIDNLNRIAAEIDGKVYKK